MQYALINAVTYTGFEVLYAHAVVIENDKIIAIKPQKDLDKDIKTIDLQGKNICAGFIDLQLNGCGGVMFNEDISVATLQQMHKTNLRFGCTTFLPTFITDIDEKIKKSVAVIRQYLALEDPLYKNSSTGAHLEGPYLSVARKGVHRPELIREMSDEMLDFYLDNADVITKMTIACENKAIENTPKLVAAGILVSIGHTDATFEQAKHAIDLGAGFATHLHNAMSPIKSGRDLGVIGAVFDSDIYAGIITDGLHVHYPNIEIAKKVKGDKLVVVTDATAAAGADIDSFIFVGKTVRVIDGKCVDEFGSLGGAAITMIDSIKNIVENTSISLSEAIAMATIRPAKAIKIDDKLGSIEVGKIANLAIFDNNFIPYATIMNGNLVYSAK